MSCHDTDITETDQSEFESRDKTPRGFSPGICGAPHLMQLESRNNPPQQSLLEVLARRHLERRQRARSGVQAMFDKFLYRK